MFDDRDAVMPELEVIELSPGEGWEARLAELASTRSPETVLLVVSHGQARVLDESGTLQRLAELGAPTVRSLDGAALVGLAGALAADPADVVVDESAVVFHRFDPAASIVIAGRVIDAETGREPAVVLCSDGGALDAALADQGGRDLARILRYQDAFDPREGPLVLQEVAPEMFVTPLWTPDFCRTVVRAAEAVGVFQASEDDPVPGHEVSLATISPRLFAHVEDDLAVRVMPAIREVWPFVDYHGLRDVFVIKYCLSGQTELRIHHDVAQLSGSVMLNDGYEGAQLTFPRQGFDNGGLSIGELLLWPSLVTHPHRCEPLVRGVKYSLTLWFELPGGQRA